MGAETGLLDQLASLLGEEGHALRIDFATLAIEPVPLDLQRLAARDASTPAPLTSTPTAATTSAAPSARPPRASSASSTSAPPTPTRPSALPDPLAAAPATC